MVIVDCEQGSDLWISSRLGLATASCFADILAQSRTKGQESASRRKLKWRIVAERASGVRAAGFESFAMRQGTERESAARLAYEVETGSMVRQVGFVRHGSLAAGASPDGLLDSDGAIECKCPEPPAHGEAILSPSEPPQYTAQIQGVMWICGLRFCDFVSFNPEFAPRHQLVIRRIERDQRYIDALASEVSVFLQECDELEALLQTREGPYYGVR